MLDQDEEAVSTPFGFLSAPAIWCDDLQLPDLGHSKLLIGGTGNRHDALRPFPGEIRAMLLQDRQAFLPGLGWKCADSSQGEGQRLLRLVFSSHCN